MDNLNDEFMKAMRDGTVLDPNDARVPEEVRQRFQMEGPNPEKVFANVKQKIAPPVRYENLSPAKQKQFDEVAEKLLEDKRPAWLNSMADDGDDAPPPALAYASVGRDAQPAKQAAKTPVEYVEEDTDVQEPVDTDDAQSTSTQIKNITYCPNCSVDVHSFDPVRITDEDKRNFIRSVLGSQLFCKKFNLFGGRVQIELRERNRSEIKLVDAVLAQELENKDLPAITNTYALQLLGNRRNELMLALSLVEFNGVNLITLESVAKKNPDMDEVAQLRKLSDLKFQSIPDIAYSAIHKQFLDFEAMCNRMKEASPSQNFWQETAG